MQANSIIHVMHARPLTSAGLAAMLQSRQWRVTLHDDQPERLALADLVVADYESGLAPREEEVLRLLARGLCNKRIARELGIGSGTVKWHLRSLMLKLDASTQAVVAAAQHGLVGIGTPRAAHGQDAP